MRGEVIAERSPEKDPVSRIRRLAPTENAKQGRFPGPVSSHEDMELPGAHRHSQIAQHMIATVALADASQLERERR
jgi:hypothetical protein